MFHPPRCPNRRCPEHRRPRPGFFLRRGSYRPLCRSQPVPRFSCRTCRRGFSRQTFRADYKDHRPDLNAKVFLQLASGLGLRQTARNLHISERCLELKARKIARHLRRLNLNLRRQLPEGSSFQFDEVESYEGRRGIRPLSIPILIERESRFVVWAESAPIRPHGKRSRVRERAILEDEKRHGKREDLSPRAIWRTLRRGAELVRHLDRVELYTDEKPSYPFHAQRAFAGKVLVHHRTNSRVIRDTFNPLFAINQTEAMARDLQGRLRRNSWLVSKRRRWLDCALHVWIAYRNYVRRRFNRDEESPAQVLGFVECRLRPEELLSWRQDWGRESLHPLARRSESVEGWERRRRAG
jgi:transposase-like protein